MVQFLYIIQRGNMKIDKKEVLKDLMKDAAVEGICDLSRFLGIEFEYDEKIPEDIRIKYAEGLDQFVEYLYKMSNIKGIKVNIERNVIVSDDVVLVWEDGKYKKVKMDK